MPSATSTLLPWNNRRKVGPLPASVGNERSHLVQFRKKSMVQFFAETKVDVFKCNEVVTLLSDITKLALLFVPLAVLQIFLLAESQSSDEHSRESTKTNHFLLFSKHTHCSHFAHLLLDCTPSDSLTSHVYASSGSLRCTAFVARLVVTVF